MNFGSGLAIGLVLGSILAWLSLAMIVKNGIPEEQRKGMGDCE